MESCDLWQSVFTETRRRLELFERRVCEGVCVEEAQDFTRYLRVSGVCRLMAENPPGSENLRQVFDYDGVKLAEMARVVETACCDYWAHKTRDSEGTARGAKRSYLEAIDGKLEGLTALVKATRTVRKQRPARPIFRIVKQNNGAL